MRDLYLKALAKILQDKIKNFSLFRTVKKFIDIFVVLYILNKLIDYNLLQIIIDYASPYLPVTMTSYLTTLFTFPMNFVNYIRVLIQDHCISLIDFWCNSTAVAFLSVMFNDFLIWLVRAVMCFQLKFTLVLGYLIAIRVGTPRYRYDYLTKLGWLKLLSLCLVILLVMLIWHSF